MILVYALLPVVFMATASAEVFTAMADIEVMLNAETQVTSVIDNYIRAEQGRLEKLKALAAEYDTKNTDIMSSGVNHIANPVNAFLLIKRLTTDWAQVEYLMRNNLAEDFLSNITSYRSANTVKFPTSEDLTGAANALMRLQDVYKLETREIASGHIKGAVDAEMLNAHDCFELGRTAYNSADYYHCLMWMQESLNRLENESPPTIDEPEVLEYLSFSLYQQGNIKRALQLTKRLVEIAPDHPRAEGNVKWYTDAMEEQGIKIATAEVPPMANVRPGNDGLGERDAYEALCRGEVVTSPKTLAKLYCYYKKDRPFLKLAPAKVEIVQFNPLAVVFVDMIFDSEIQVIKRLAYPRLARATVQNSATGQLETAPYRVSKSAWLKESDHEVVKRVNHRIDLYTNLNMETAEDLQIANYGLGGQYEPHYDMSTKEEVNAFKGLGTGNRIATVLFYMTQPEAGGATVFPILKTAQFPRLHSALFWYNLHRDGEGDMRTRHAGCPVLAGTKWVSNKWIHERGNEFRRPCNLRRGEYANENFVGEL